MQNENNAAGQYGYAMKKGRKTAARDRLKKKDPYLAVLDDIVDDKVCQSVDLGEIDVPSQLIIGTKNSSRANAFSSDFMPILNEKSEFANSWMHVCRSHLSDEGIRQVPIAYEYMGKFYIEEGNKQVSVLKSYGAPYIPLQVTRLLPANQNSAEGKLYDEFTSFYELSKLYSLQFSKPGYYQKLISLLGYEKDHIWTEKERITIIGLYERLRNQMIRKGIPADNADFIVALLELYGYDYLIGMSDKQLDKVINENKTRLTYGKGFYNIVCISDEEDPLLYSQSVKKVLEDCDFIISAGDLKNEYLEYIVTLTNKPLFYVHGNHDSETPPEGCICIDDDLVEYEGIRLLGLGGSIRYSNDTYQYTELQMERRIRKLKRKISKAKGVDIVVTHAPIKGYGDLDDYAHQGFECFVKLLNELKPRFWFYGHVHTTYGPLQKQAYAYKNTMIINVSGTYKAKY